MQNRVEEHRRQLGMTQQELSDLSGVPRPSIAMIEEGKREPGIITALLLARALETTVEELFPIPD